MLSPAAPASACCHREHLMPHGKQAGEVPLAIGDSVMLGAAPQLARGGIEVDAKEGRVMHAALSILRRRRRVGTLPDAVVIALGTNIPARPEEVAAAIRLLGRDRTLVLVAPLRAWSPFGGAAFWRAKRLHPHTVGIADWAAVAPAGAGWLYGDGTHLRPAGARAYTRLIRFVLRGAFRGGCGVDRGEAARSVPSQAQNAPDGCAALALDL